MIIIIIAVFEALLLHPGIGAKYCDEYVCVCVSVCPRGYLRNHTRDLYHFWCMLSMAVARSSSRVVAICCVLPVLRMTLYFFYNRLYSGLNFAMNL